jgi:hypothetical protein
MRQKWSMQGALNMAGALLLRETIEQAKQREQAADATRKAQQLGRKLDALRSLNDGQRKTPLNGALTPNGVSKSAYEGLI